MVIVGEGKEISDLFTFILFSLQVLNIAVLATFCTLLNFILKLITSELVCLVLLFSAKIPKSVQLLLWQ